MKAIWLLALNDLRLTVRDRPAFFWMVAMPLAMMWFFGGMGGGSDTPPRIAISIDDRDGEWLATAFVEDLAQDSVVLAPLPGQGGADDRPAIRTLIIPEGFTRAVLSGTPQTLRLEQAAGSDEAYGFAAQVHLVRTIVRTSGRLIELDGVQDALPDRFDRLVRRPRLVDVEIETAGTGRAVPSGFRQSVPGNLTFLVLMMTLIYGGVFLTIEKREGMLRRQAMLPISRLSIFAGKLLGRWLLAVMQIGILVLAGRYLFDISWGSSPVGLLLVLASYAAAVASLSTLLGAILSTPGQASSVGWIVAMVLAALGGCWWPSEVMPGWMQRLAHAFPTAWAMDAFHALISFGYGLPQVLVPSAALLGFAAAFTVVGARLLRYE